MNNPAAGQMTTEIQQQSMIRLDDAGQRTPNSGEIQQQNTIHQLDVDDAGQRTTNTEEIQQQDMIHQLDVDDTDQKTTNKGIMYRIETDV